MHYKTLVAKALNYKLYKIQINEAKQLKKEKRKKNTKIPKTIIYKSLERLEHNWLTFFKKK